MEIMNSNGDRDGGLGPYVPTTLNMSCPDQDGDGHGSCGLQASGCHSASGSPPARLSNEGHEPKKPSGQTLQIENFLDKPLEDITAKQYRRLIPLMVKRLRYPKTGKMKVRGLWKAENRPKHWPEVVRFRDPNNNQKLKKKESKLVFQALRDSLRQVLTLQKEPLQSSLPPQVSSPRCEHGTVSSMQQPVVSGKTSEIGGKTMMLLQTAAVPCESTPSFPTEAQQQPNVIYVFGDENFTHPVNPQSCDIQTVPGMAQHECVEFVSKFETSLQPTFTEFSKMFQTETEIMDKMEDFIRGTYEPMLNAAKCSKQGCAELSKLCSQLEEILKRFTSTLWKGTYSAEDIVRELDFLQAKFKVPELVTNADVPGAAHEIQMMTALCTGNTVPTLMNETNLYMPTIAGLERAKQKERMLEKNVEVVDYGDPESKMSFDNSKSLMSPLRTGVERMDLDETDIEQSLVDPVQDCGIKLKDAGCEKTEKQQMSGHDMMEKYLSEGNILGIDVRLNSSGDEIVNTLPARQSMQSPPTSSTALQDYIVPVTNGGVDQVDFSIMENPAGGVTMARMCTRVVGSVTSEAPHTVTDNIMIPDEWFSLVDRYIEQGTSPGGSNDFGIDVRSVSWEETDETSPASVTTLQHPVVAVTNDGVRQMQKDSSILENQAVDAMMAAMYSHFGDSTGHPPTARTDQVGVEVYLPQDGCFQEGTSPDFASNVPLVEPPPRIEPPTSPKTIQWEAKFAYLKGITSSVIPTTVFDVAADQDQDQGRKGSRFKKGKRH